LHMAQLMPLPLTVSCFSKIQIGFTLLVPDHLGSPGQRAVKRVCVCVCVNRGTMGVSSLPKTVNRQRRDCDFNPGPSVPESSTLTTCYRATPKLTVTREKCSFGGRRHVGQLKHSELQSQHHGCTQHLTN